jgi:hypothetical protein
LDDHPTFLWLGASWRIFQQVIHWDNPQPINHGAFWQTLPRSCAAAPIWHSLVTFKRNSSSSSSSSQSHVYIYHQLIIDLYIYKHVYIYILIYLYIYIHVYIYTVYPVSISLISH